MALDPPKGIGLPCPKCGVPLVPDVGDHDHYALRCPFVGCGKRFVWMYKRLCRVIGVCYKCGGYLVDIGEEDPNECAICS